MSVNLELEAYMHGYKDGCGKGIEHCISIVNDILNGKIANHTNLKNLNLSILNERIHSILLNKDSEVIRTIYSTTDSLVKVDVNDGEN